MTRPRLLDLFCCAGGAGTGYHRAGFDVTGVDISPQPHYPFTFVQGDALAYLAEHGPSFDAIHASPPCQDHSVLTSVSGTHGTGWLLGATRTALIASGRPWIIENVPGAAMRNDYALCGCMFALPGLYRERWFETSWAGFALRSPCSHDGPTITVTGSTGSSSRTSKGTVADWRRAMGIDWMTARELAQAIPPAYTEYLGGELLAALAHDRRHARH